VTFDPVRVMTMVRPAALELELDGLDDVGDDVVAGLVEELLVAADPASSPAAPQAVSTRARARPAAHGTGPHSVIFVTNPSLNSAI
jgi:hypothetical protein